MQESYGEGPASRPDPESCGNGRKAVAEALTGAHAGQPSSCEIRSFGVPMLLPKAEGNTRSGVIGEPAPDPAQSETLSMRGTSSHGNWEIPQAATGDGPVARPEKAQRRTSGMHACGKSDGRVVPQKPPNNGTTPTEVAEGRRPTEGNSPLPAADLTQSRTPASPGLQRVREAARQDRTLRFTALLHHVTVDLLRDSFLALKRQAAPGLDGVTWAEYEEGLEGRLPDLHQRVQSGTYRAQPSKRAYIPKPDGRLRPLGIAALEDKIVQSAVVTVLNQIYESDFLGFSYGFRPQRSAHNALDALWMGLMGKKVNWVLDGRPRRWARRKAR
jgi:RNA-directed DNA polymerase